MPYTVETAITECAYNIRLIGDEIGVHRTIKYPILSILLGKETEAQAAVIHEVFTRSFGRDSDKENLFKPMSRADLDSGAVQERVYSLGTNDLFSDKTQLFCGFFIDLLDDDYEDNYKKLDTIKAPFGTDLRAIYFFFCRQYRPEDKPITEDRLKKVFEWQKQTDNTIFIFSDVSLKGGVSEEKRKDHFRACADIMVMLAASYPALDSLGTNLRFYLFEQADNKLFTASYDRLLKNDLAISAVCMTALLEAYKDSAGKSNGSYKGPGGLLSLLGTYKTYNDYFDKVADDLRISCAPADTSFLEVLPVLDNRVQEKSSNTGILGGLFGKKESVSNPGNISIPQYIKDIRALTFKVYGDIELSEAEEMRIRERFRSDLTRCVPFNQMSDIFEKELDYVEALPASSEAKQFPNALSAFNAAAHSYLMKQLKELLIAEMNELRIQAPALEKNIDRLCTDLRQHVGNENYFAYKTLVDAAIRDGDYLTSFAPGNDDKLLRCAIQAVNNLAKKEPAIFNKSLTEELNFMAASAAKGGVGDVISDCFQFDLKKTIPLIGNFTNDGEEYDILNLTDLDDRKDDIPGTIFNVSRNDCIERLLLFRIDKAESVML